MILSEPSNTTYKRIKLIRTTEIDLANPTNISSRTKYYTYNNQGLLQEISRGIDSTFSNNQWTTSVYVEKEKYYYNANNLCSKVQFEQNGNVWDRNYVYDEVGDLLYEIFFNGAVVDSVCYFNYYKPKGKLKVGIYDNVGYISKYFYSKNKDSMEYFHGSFLKQREIWSYNTHLDLSNIYLRKYIPNLSTNELINYTNIYNGYIQINENYQVIRNSEGYILRKSG